MRIWFKRSSLFIVLIRWEIASHCDQRMRGNCGRCWTNLRIYRSAISRVAWDFGMCVTVLDRTQVSPAGELWSQQAGPRAIARSSQTSGGGAHMLGKVESPHRLAHPHHSQPALCSPTLLQRHVMLKHLAIATCLLVTPCKGPPHVTWYWKDMSFILTNTPYTGGIMN